MRMIVTAAEASWVATAARAGVGEPLGRSEFLRLQQSTVFQRQRMQDAPASVAVTTTCESLEKLQSNWWSANAPAAPALCDI